jgi:hypothetical protein
MSQDPMQPDAASCTTALNSGIDTKYAQEEAAIAQGALRYDPVAGAQCIDESRASSSDCSAVDDPKSLNGAPCDRVLVGTIAEGSACDPTAFACAPGLYCAPTGSVGSTCTQDAQSGQPCAMVPCAEGLTCLPAGTCGAPLENGAACTSGTVCKSLLCDEDITHSCVSETVEQLYCG